MQKTKTYVLLLFCLNTYPLLFSQGYIKKDLLATASIGFPHLSKFTAIVITQSKAFKNNFQGDLEIGPIKGVNPIALKYEYAFTKRFGLGISVAWWTVRINVYDHYNTGTGSNLRPQTDTYGLKISSVSFGIRPNFHFPLKRKKGDLFIGCALGITRNNLSTTFSSTQNNSLFSGSFSDFNLPNTVYISPTIAYRTFLVNNFGLNFELGYEKGAIVQIGFVFRFRPMNYEPIK